MKISIITVSCNSVLTIRDTFESVLSQTYTDIDYVVIDNNSKDGTVSIIKEYDSKFDGRMRWVSESDNGLYDAMNKGILMTQGDIIGILNSDDYYASNAVLEIVCKTMNTKNIDSCYGNLLYIRNNKPYRYWYAGVHKSFKLGWMPPHPAFFVRKTIYEKYGSFRLDCGSSADYELMLRFLQREDISTSWINELFVMMRVGGISNNSFSSRLNAYSNDKNSWKINNITPYFLTFFLKKILKIPQYFLVRRISGKTLAELRR